MTTIEFQRKACEFVASFSNSLNDEKIKPEEVTITFTSPSPLKKCMLETSISDGRFYEVDYNEEKKTLNLRLIEKTLIDVLRVA